jgi:putative two-component system response regulator
LILLDIQMPEMNGIEAMQKLKSDYRFDDIPVIFLTGWIDSDIEARGFELGAVDFIPKPFSVGVLLNRVKSHLDIDDLIRERTGELHRLQSGIVHVLADIVESRDKGTGGHVARTTEYVRLLIDAMMERGIYIDELKKWDVEMAVSSARLHDVGKITISDSILNKPERLSPAEIGIMQTHVAEGEYIIDQMISRTGDGEAFLYNAKMFAGHQHEKWNGTGYPRALKGAAIPLQGRIMAVSDVYDALVSVRPYKKAFTDDEAANVIMEDSGTHFDPEITNIFFDIKDKFKAVTANLCQQSGFWRKK